MKNIDNKVSNLLEIMNELREKCPWDRKQTLDSLKRLTIEETFELIEAIEKKDFDNIKEELGDLFLHIVFYSKISSEKKYFDFCDVIDFLIKKLIDRHPHVYADNEEISEEQVKINWEKIKLKNNKKGLLSGVPKSMPPISKAYRVQEKVSSIGFNWDNSQGVFEKIEEELKEFNDALKENNKDKINEEYGDILFTLINYSRFIDVDPEISLNSSTNKFIKRFNSLEILAKNNNKKISELSFEQLNKMWKKIKSSD